MELTVFERANLLNILPREGNFKTLKTIRKLRENLSLNEEENKKWQPVISDDGKMRWKVTDDAGNPIPQNADIEISELGKEVIIEVLRDLDKQNKLKDEHYTLYTKFVEPAS